MKLSQLILEGMYDKITGIVIKRIFTYIKKATEESGTQEKPKKYKGIPVRKDIKIPALEPYFLTSDTHHLGEYYDKTSEIAFDLYSSLLLNNEVPRGTVYMDGYATGGQDKDSSEADIYINIAINPEDGTSIYSKIQAKLRDVVRHEIEHLTQKGPNQKAGKKVKNTTLARIKAANNPDKAYTYYTLPDEVDANIQGLYSKAKTTKQPFQVVVDDFLDGLVADKIIKPTDKEKIYKVWQKRIPKIGGLPTLK